MAPFSTPSYSNAAFSVLGFALENITGSSLSDLLTSALIGPLGLNGSSYAQPASANRSIVPFDSISSFYSGQLFDAGAAGGCYSSLNDMTKFGISILNSTFLTPAQTRNWLKPESLTSNVNSSVGAPWEIYRAPGERVSYLYTKNGQLGLYSSQMVLMPDYNVGFTVLAAGASGPQQVSVLSDLLTEVFYPALEAAAREEADDIYAGTFQDPNGLNSSMIIATDDRPGLGVEEWIFNGTAVNSIVKAAAFSQAPDGLEFSIRLYPTGLKTTRAGQITRTAWRAVLESPSSRNGGPLSPACVSWATTDLDTYGGIGLDEFVFNLGPDDKAVSIEPRVLQQSPLEAVITGKMVRK